MIADGRHRMASAQALYSCMIYRYQILLSRSWPIQSEHMYRLALSSPPRCGCDFLIYRTMRNRRIATTARYLKCQVYLAKTTRISRLTAVNSRLRRTSECVTLVERDPTASVLLFQPPTQTRSSNPVRHSRPRHSKTYHDDSPRRSDAPSSRPRRPVESCKECTDNDRTDRASDTHCELDESVTFPKS